MAEHHLPLASVYKGWDSYQHHLVTVIAPLSPEQLTLRAAPPLRSLGEQVAHIRVCSYWQTAPRWLASGRLYVIR